VDYDGRASSTLDWGERVVIIKKDGSVLVHRPTGYEPVNWQPPSCLVRLSRSDASGLIVNASRAQPRENVSIEYRDVSLAAFGSLNDTGEFALHVTEGQMKQAILTAPNLVEDGLKPLAEEKHISETGFTDIYAEDKNGLLVVVEITRNSANRDAIMQLQRYLEKMRKRTDRQLRGIVVAPYIRKSALPLLESLKIEFIKVAPEQCFAVLKTQKDMKISQFIAVSEDGNSKLI
jgi:RecB family endonuclease NucS